MLATEFPSEDALKKYLKEHPKADPHRHTVKKSPGAKPGGNKPPASQSKTQNEWGDAKKMDPVDGLTPAEIRKDPEAALKALVKRNGGTHPLADPPKKWLQEFKKHLKEYSEQGDPVPAVNDWMEDNEVTPMEESWIAETMIDMEEEDALVEVTQRGWLEWARNTDKAETKKHERDAALEYLEHFQPHLLKD